MCLVNRRGLGKAKHVNMQNLWIQEASKAWRFVSKKVLTKPKIDQLMSVMGYDFLRTDVDSLEGRLTGA